MRLSDFLLFPDIKIVSGSDSTSLTTFSNDPVDDPDVAEILNQLLIADSIDEIRFILTLAYQQYYDGSLSIDTDDFFQISPD